MPKDQIRVRPLVWENDEINRILVIENASFNQYDAYNRTDFNRWVHINPDLSLVAEKDGQIAGYVITRILPTTGDLASLAIHPDYRRQGIGEDLVKETVRRVKKYNVGRIELEVRRSNQAGLLFWSRMGFSPFGEYPLYYGDGEDAIRMRRWIPDYPDQV